MELYIKTAGDPNYVATEVQVESEVEMLISQIEMILFTRRGDVIGSPDLGCNLEDTLYTLGFNEHQLKSLINQQLFTYSPLAAKYNIKVDVIFERGEVRDRAYIDILIDNKYAITVAG
jgi:phage baseplate assembly protein W